MFPVVLQCSQNLMRVTFCKNAGIMREHFLLKCGYFAGFKSQKCGYITKKMRVLCGYFKMCNTFSSLFMYTKLFSFHSIYKLALPCPVKKEVLFLAALSSSRSLSVRPSVGRSVRRSVRHVCENVTFRVSSE